MRKNVCFLDVELSLDVQVPFIITIIERMRKNAVEPIFLFPFAHLCFREIGIGLFKSSSCKY